MVRKSPRRKKHVNRMTYNSDGKYVEKKKATPSLERMWTHTLVEGGSENRIHRRRTGRSKSPSSSRRKKKKSNDDAPDLQRMWTHTLSSGRTEDRIHRVVEEKKDDDENVDDTKIYEDDNQVFADNDNTTSISTLVPNSNDIKSVMYKVGTNVREITSELRNEVETYVNSSAVWVTKSKIWNRTLQWAAALILVCFVAETISPTAYGRFGDSSSIALDSRLGWFLMEFPCSVVFVYQFFIVGGPRSHLYVPRCMAAVFCCHYLYRGWIFPSMINTYAGVKNFSIVPALFSWIVTCTHAYLNAKWFSTWGTHLDRRWVRTRCFKLSALTYYIGLVLIIWHDKILRDLRPCPDGQRYCIPEGGLFDYATCGQYTSELIAWFGFWAMSCGPNGAFIFLVSVANLVPRSVVTHHWYLSKFDSYASLDRARLIPFVW